MTVSLIISTYNYPEALDIIISAIDRQIYLPDEIIIAEDGNDIKTKEIVNSWRNKISCEFIHVNHSDSGFRKALILNKAIKLSKSEDFETTTL